MILFVVVNALLVSQKNAGTAGFFSSGREKSLMIPKVRKLALLEAKTPLFIHQLGSIYTPNVQDSQRLLCICPCVHSASICV